MKEVLNVGFKKIQYVDCYSERIFSWREEQKKSEEIEMMLHACWES